jgi:hypothetical protein
MLSHTVTPSIPALLVGCFLLGNVQLSAQALNSQGNATTSSSSAGSDGDDLAMKLANPVASLISVPFQSNLDFGIGSNDATRFTLNIQPVIPFELNDNWNLITRTILPVINVEAPVVGAESAFGIGDIVQSYFLSPKKTVGGWILGGGPVLLFPTASDDALGLGHWGVGPTAIALQQKGAWTYGVLANHLWSVVGEEDRSDVNATFLNPFVSYVTPQKTTFSISPELTYDWGAEQWLAPVNLVVSQLFKIGNQPMQVALGGRYYFDAPSGGPEWGLRLGFTLLFPK